MSSGPFTSGVSNLSLGWSRSGASPAGITRPRQPAFAAGHRARYPASWTTATRRRSRVVLASCSCCLSAAGVDFLGVLFPPRDSASLTVGLPPPPKRRRTLTGFPLSCPVVSGHPTICTFRRLLASRGSRPGLPAASGTRAESATCENCRTARCTAQSASRRMPAWDIPHGSRVRP
jgi:hypothetical protein